MKKFNEFEAHLLEQGLKLYCTQIINDIIDGEKNGRRPIMTADYVRAIELQALTKLKSLTLKQK
jgi:hypothetical protein